MVMDGPGKNILKFCADKILSSLEDGSPTLSRDCIIP